ncbi:MAG: efflux RND transporter periplasmic adaptor subunit [Deltaproteobacteria bacterium]|nr:efflux RND transporter periplasmic adaptor subunit [Deltaproteobacteria bacterium]
MNEQKPRRRGLRIVGILCGVAGLVVLMLYMAGVFTSGKIGPGRVPDMDGPVTPEKTARAVKEAATEFYEAVGTVRPKQETRVESQVQGRIVEVLVRPGDRVKKGVRLVLLDSRELRARLDRAKQALLSAQARRSQAMQAVNSAKAAFSKAESAYQRVQTYFKSEAATQQQLEEARAAFLQAKAGLEQAGDGLRVADAGVKQAEKVVEESRIALGYKEIRATSSGEVGRRLVEPGDMAFPGKPLVVLQTRGDLRLEALVPERLIKRMRIGETFEVVVDAVDQTLTGRLAEVVPSADPTTRSFVVKVDLPKAHGLYPGMFGRLLVPVSEVSVIWIPRSALRRVGQLEMVTAKIGDQWREIYVTSGKSSKGRVEILSGLKGDEMVAVTGGLE